MRARVVIVGGGVMGVSIAWHAARRADALAEPVVLLEKKALAAGSSGRSGAILRQHYSDRVVAAMARDSLRVYAGLERRTGRSIGFERTGVLTLAGPERAADIALIERNIAMQLEIGIDTRRVEAPAIRDLVPGIAVADGSIGAWEPDGGGVDPVRTVEAFAALAREQGAITRIGVEATDLRIAGGRVRGVETSAGSIEAEQVVIATGPWTRRLLLRAGIDVPLRVVRPEQQFLVMPEPEEHSNALEGRAAVAEERRAKERVKARAEPLGTERGIERGVPPVVELADRFAHSERSPRSAHPVLLDLEYGYYTRCEPARARTRIGRMDYSHDREIDDPDALDENVSAEFQRWARASIERRLPVYRRQDDAGTDVGMYTLSPDAQALIGPLAGIAGLFLVSGFSGHGFKLAPSIGEGVAQMLWDEPISAFDRQFFAPERFEGKETAWGGAFGL